MDSGIASICALFVLGFQICISATLPQSESLGEGIETRFKIPFKKADPSCLTPMDKDKVAVIAKELADLVNKALDKGGAVIKNPTERTKFTDVTQRVTDAFKGGWDQPNAIDAVASAIADPLKQIPKVGPVISSTVKSGIIVTLNAKKLAAGC